MTYNEMMAEGENVGERMSDFTGCRIPVQNRGTNSMQLYTSQFLKVLTQILQRSQ